jgi:hypothetical protein
MTPLRGVGLLAAAFLLGRAPVLAQDAPERAGDRAGDRAEIIHVLNRISFGPKPGDVEAVEKMGVHAYIEQQLHPESIDDSQVNQEVAQYELLQMSAPQLVKLFYDEAKNQLKEQKKLAA